MAQLPEALDGRRGRSGALAADDQGLRRARRSTARSAGRRPGPFRCGSTTWSVKPVATAASKALPPRSSIAIPVAEASQWVDATIPKVPRSSGRVVKLSVRRSCQLRRGLHDARRLGSATYQVARHEVPLPGDVDQRRLLVRRARAPTRARAGTVSGTGTRREARSGSGCLPRARRGSGCAEDPGPARAQRRGAPVCTDAAAARRAPRAAPPRRSCRGTSPRRGRTGTRRSRDRG